MRSLSELQEVLNVQNVQAFLRVIRAGESNQSPEAYTLLFGGSHFDDLSKHPRHYQFVPKYGVTTSAAGAYQIVASTWDGLVRRLRFTDFSPDTQDLAAVALIDGRGALDDVVEGRFETALHKLGKEWASLPFSPYGQPVMTLERARQVYEEYGGTFYTEEATPTPTTPTEQPDMNFIDIAASALSAVVPELQSLYIDKGEKQKAAIAQAVVNIAKNVTGATNEQAVVEAVKDPSQAVAVRNEIRSRWVELQEIGGGLEAAHKRGLDIMDKRLPLWKNPAWAFTLLVIPLVYFVVAVVIGNIGSEGWGTGTFNEEIRVFVVSSIISGVLGSLVGYWAGTSFTSSKKDDALLGRK